MKKEKQQHFLLLVASLSFFWAELTACASNKAGWCGLIKPSLPKQIPIPYDSTQLNRFSTYDQIFLLRSLPLF